MNSRDPSDPQLSELSEAARRAGELFSHHVDEITADAKQNAEEIRTEAQQDADATRRAALESGRRVFERINALEQPLTELVGTLRHEMERVTAELTDGQQVVELPQGEVTEDPAPAPQVEAAPKPEPETETPEPTGEEAEPESEAQPEPAAEPEVAAPTALHETPDTTAVHETPDAPQADEAPLTPPPAPPQEQTFTQTSPPPKPRRGLFGRRSRKQPFLGVPGECAVCQRSYQADSEEELAASGWSISGDVGLCPDCQSDGWQLPEGAQLPFRRGG